MPHVLIPNKGIHDYSQAEEYGKLVFLTHGHYPIFSLGRMTRELQTFVDASHEDDLILVSGPSTMIGILMSLMALKHKGRVNLLLYYTSPTSSGYKKRTVMLGDPNAQLDI